MKMAAVLLGLVVVAVLFATGCGASAIEAHTASALVVRDALNTSGNMIHDDMHQKATAAASDESVDTAEAELNAHNVVRGYNQALKLHGAAVTTWQLWVTSLLSAYKDNLDDEDTWRSLAANAFKSYKDLAIEALRHDLRIPSVLGAMQATLKKK